MQVIKRDGQVAGLLDPDKIYQATLKAAQTVYVLIWDDLCQNSAHD